MYECFHCLHRSLVWQNDFDFDDYGYEGEGIVHVLTCANCGAEVEYAVRTDEIAITAKMKYSPEEREGER